VLLLLLCSFVSICFLDGAGISFFLLLVDLDIDDGLVDAFTHD
jgi:hypothetical protein